MHPNSIDRSPSTDWSQPLHWLIAAHPLHWLIAAHPPIDRSPSIDWSQPIHWLIAAHPLIDRSPSTDYYAETESQHNREADPALADNHYESDPSLADYESEEEEDQTYQLIHCLQQIIQDLKERYPDSEDSEPDSEDSEPEPHTHDEPMSDLRRRQLESSASRGTTCYNIFWFYSRQGPLHEMLRVQESGQLGLQTQVYFVHDSVNPAARRCHVCHCQLHTNCKITLGSRVLCKDGPCAREYQSKSLELN